MSWRGGGTVDHDLGPVLGQPFALLLDDCGGRIVDEAAVAQLAFGLAQFGLLAPELAVQPREFLVDVDQALERDEHLEFADQRDRALGGVGFIVKKAGPRLVGQFGELVDVRHGGRGVDRGPGVVLEGQRRGDRFVWSDGKTQRSRAMPVYPTNHWNTAVLGQAAVLNTLTGEINSVTIHDEGEETLELAGSSLPATRYRYDGQLQLESWYDRTGRWLAMRFVVDDGSTIRYQCSNCATQASL